LGHFAIKVQQLHSQLVKKVGAVSFFNIFFINYFFETLAFCQSENIFSDMSQVDILNERFHEHHNKVFLGILLLLKKFDEVIML